MYLGTLINVMINEPKAALPKWYAMRRFSDVKIGEFKSDLSLDLCIYLI